VGDTIVAAASAAISGPASSTRCGLYSSSARLVLHAAQLGASSRDQAQERRLARAVGADDAGPAGPSAGRPRRAGEPNRDRRTRRREEGSA
jgi:hypothetical protein